MGRRCPSDVAVDRRVHGERALGRWFLPAPNSPCAGEHAVNPAYRHRSSSPWGLLAVLASALLLGACAGELPKDRGVWHSCAMTVHVDGFGTALHSTKICADRGLPTQDYEEACVDKCEDEFSYFCVGLEFDPGDEKFQLLTCSPDCVTTNVSPTSLDCRNASIVPGAPTIGQALVVLEPASTSNVTIDGESSGAVTPAGTLYYSAAPCAAP